MKKIFNILSVFVLCFVLVGGQNLAFAQLLSSDSCENDTNLPVSYIIKDTYIIGDIKSNFSITVSGLRKDSVYVLSQRRDSKTFFREHLTAPSDSTGTVTFKSGLSSFTNVGQYIFSITGPGISRCQLERGFTLVNETMSCKGYTVWQDVEQADKSIIQCSQEKNGCINTSDQINIRATIINTSDGSFVPKDTPIFLNLPGIWLEEKKFVNGNGVVEITTSALNAKTYNLDLERGVLNLKANVCTITFKTENNCDCSVIGEGNANSLPAIAQTPFSLCKQIPDGSDFTEQRTACLECTGGSETKEENRGIWTAVGCIKRDPQSIMQKLIKVGLGMSGGVALLTFLASGFIFSTSQGDPKAYGKAKEMMTAAIVGLIFIIFSVTMLQFIGYEILKIPGFGG